MATIVEGNVGQEVRLTGNGKVNAYNCVNDSSVIIQIALDTKTARFTPTKNKTYKISITEDGKIRYIDVVVGGTAPPPPAPEPEVPPIPEPEQPPSQGEELLYSSNIHGKWNNGVKRTVTKIEGENKPNGKYIRMNASGKPRMHILGNGEGILETDKGDDGGDTHGRAYIGACNYNCRLQKQTMFMDDTADNDSDKLNARHQFADEIQKDAPDTKKQGGLGNAWFRDQMKNKIEVVHAKGSACSYSGSFSPKMKTGEWFGTKFSVWHDNEKKIIYEKSELEYPLGTGFRIVKEHECKDAPSQFFNEKDFNDWSEFWLRENGYGRIKHRNVELYKITKKP